MPEWCLGGLGLVMLLFLWARTGLRSETVATAAVLAIYGIGVWRTTPHSGCRLGINYGLVWAGYAGSSRIIAALEIPRHSAQLLAADRLLFGETPSIAMSAFPQAWVGELLSGAYLSYQLYLLWALMDAGSRPESWRASLNRGIFTAFAVGFAGYFLAPAASPYQAFPELYGQPVSGAWITRTNESLNAHLAAHYDAFPSLHVLITLTLLAFDWRHDRQRFWFMIVPSFLMGVATLALRLHYGVDLLAGVLLFALLDVAESRHDQRMPLP